MASNLTPRVRVNRDVPSAVAPTAAQGLVKRESFEQRLAREQADMVSRWSRAIRSTSSQGK